MCGDRQAVNGRQYGESLIPLEPTARKPLYYRLLCLPEEGPN